MALSTYPSEFILDNLRFIVILFFIKPEFNSNVFLKLLYDPAEDEYFNLKSSDALPVLILTVPPKAPPPFVEDPTPLCTCMLLADEARSDTFTQKTP